MLKLNKNNFGNDFPNKHFLVEHLLANHSLFSLDEILPTLINHPPHLVECRRGDLESGDGLSHEHTYGLTKVQIENQLTQKNSWLQIRHIQLISQYRDMVRQCMDEIMSIVQPRRLGIQQPVGYILMSSPGAVTPFHFDNEHNFLLQISGTKTVHTWSAEDEQAVTSGDKERYYRHGYHDVEFDQKLQNSTTKYELTPGVGLHIPVHSPHWVVTGSEVAVSLAITFLTDKLQKEAHIHWLNSLLTSKGIKTKAYGKAPLVDMGKYYAALLWQKYTSHRLRPYR